MHAIPSTELNDIVDAIPTELNVLKSWATDFVGNITLKAFTDVNVLIIDHSGTLGVNYYCTRASAVWIIRFHLVGVQRLVLVVQYRNDMLRGLLTASLLPQI